MYVSLKHDFYNILLALNEVTVLVGPLRSSNSDRIGEPERPRERGRASASVFGEHRGYLSNPRSALINISPALLESFVSSLTIQEKNINTKYGYLIGTK